MDSKKVNKKEYNKLFESMLKGLAKHIPITRLGLKQSVIKKLTKKEEGKDE